jgi:lipopolysaccharide export system protein LptC
MTHTVSNAVASPESLLNWAPQRQMTLEQARKRSSLVGLIRMLFVAGAAISAGVMIGPIAASTFSSVGSGVEDIPADQVVTMVNARFTGRNIAGEAFVITADTARRRRADPSIIDLTNPRMVDDAGTEVEAPTGTYHQKEEYLDLF